MPEMNPSVGVFVVLYKAALMGVRVYVPLPIVAVFVFVLVLMLDVCVRMRHVPVGVLVSMLRGHSAPLLVVSIRRGPPTTCELIEPRLHASHGSPPISSAAQLNASSLQVTKRRRYLSLELLLKSGP